MVVWWAWPPLGLGEQLLGLVLDLGDGLLGELLPGDVQPVHLHSLHPILLALDSI